ncbi:MAG: EamA family transporter [Fimbriimonadaceae bacterium]|nr:EamA family transporter [Fimbriimonadaceae bacterium]
MPALVGALLAALLAATGNAIFAYGQRKSISAESPMLFNAYTFLIALICVLILAAFQMPKDPAVFLKVNWKHALFTGIGTAITYYGFYILYGKYGASYYALYGMSALLTTSIGVGVFIFREKFNVYYALSVVTAIITMILFLLGQREAKPTDPGALVTTPAPAPESGP